MVRCTVRAGGGRLHGCSTRTLAPPRQQTIALALQRIESAGKSGAERESAAARKPARRQGWRRFAGEQRNGLSVDTVNHIRAAVEGYWGFDTQVEEDDGEERPDAPATGRFEPS